MSKFDAGTYVEPMEYDFTTYGGRSGVVPEPTKGELDVFQTRAQDIFKRSIEAQPKTAQPTTVDEMRELMEKADEQQGADLLGELFEAVVNLCNGSPSREELEALPGRIQQGFCVWIAQELSNPNYKGGASAQTNGTSAASSISSGGTSGSGPKR